MFHLVSLFPGLSLDELAAPLDIDKASAMSPTPMIKEESIIVSIHLCTDPEWKGYRSYMSATAAFPMKFTAFTQTLKPRPRRPAPSAASRHCECDCAS